MNLVDELSKFDGKRTASLHGLAERLLNRKENVSELIALAASDRESIQSAATWVLKNVNELNYQFSKTQTNSLVRLLDKLTRWDAKLHVLQILPDLSLPAQEYDKLHIHLKSFVTAENKFIRAWAYNGLAVLGDQQSSLRLVINSMLKQAQQDPAPSVRARVRNVCKSLGWADLNG